MVKSAVWSGEAALDRLTVKPEYTRIGLRPHADQLNLH